MTRKVVNHVSKAGLTRIGEEFLQWASRQSICGCGWTNVELSETQGRLKIRCMECGVQMEVEPCLPVPDLLAALEEASDAIGELGDERLAEETGNDDWRGLSARIGNALAGARGEDAGGWPEPPETW